MSMCLGALYYKIVCVRSDYIIPITDLYYLAIVSYKIEFVYPTTIIHIEL